MKSANSNTNTASQMTQSWAHTVSDYILQRRTQNKLAYETAFKAQNVLPVGPVDIAEQGSAAAVSEENNDWLFKALFIALAQQLEEGHTVLTLSTDIGTNTNTAIDRIESTSSTLYGWQQQLMTILLSPLSDYSDRAMILTPNSEDQEENTTATLSNNPINQLLIQWPRVALQLALPTADTKVLTQRHTLALTLYKYFQSTNKLKENKENSLSNIVDLISQDKLFSITDNNRATPIRFKKYKKKNSLSITLWIQRTWQAEYTLAQKIQSIGNSKVIPLPITINDKLNTEQKAAIDMANNSAFSIITGGPGTGKTYTVAQLVIALKSTETTDKITKNTTKKQNASLALAAPTGKAAQRMQESLQAALDVVGVDMQLQEAKTIHRLLGIGQSGQPRYHAKNPLSEDIIIIDEASMLGVELANDLVSAIKPGARLILLGDANQLAAVDAGAVLADLCRIPMLQSQHQQLTDSRRFTAESGIGQLAAQINSPKTDMTTVWSLLAKEDTLLFQSVKDRIDIANNKTKDLSIDSETNINSSQNINSLSNYKITKKLANQYKKYINEVKYLLNRRIVAKSEPKVSNAAIANELLMLFSKFRILTAGHHGRWGDYFLNSYLSEWHINELKLPLSNSPWFHGRPIMVLQNSYEIGLFNGDIGICLQTEKGLEVFFENKQQGIAVNLLNDEMIATAYAMTIHKSQGSEFEHVAITFDDTNSRLLNQELIYTAVTRAKQKVSIFSTASAFTRALNTPTVRQTGLALQFEALAELD